MSVPGDRRRAPRIATRFPVRYRLMPVLANGYDAGQVEDLSPDGIRFRCRAAIRTHASLLFEMIVPGAPPVRSFARATWVRELPDADGFEIGSRFVDQSTAARKAIERHLQRDAGETGP